VLLRGAKVVPFKVFSIASTLIAIPRFMLTVVAATRNGGYGGTINRSLCS
jgi:hypothetical protein